MKQTIEKIVLSIPFFGKRIKKLYRFIKGKKDFSTSTTYWEERYKDGGNSGTGSYNKLAEFKAEVLNDFVEKHDVKTVIEFGSGDGNQLKYLHFPKYTGFDISETIINACRKEYINDQTKSFKTVHDYSETDAAELTLSLDVIYHLIEDEVYNKYMQRLFQSSNKYVIIYSSNMIDTNYEGTHVRHRKFTAWVEENAKSFKLVRFIQNKYPFNGDNNISSLADFYFYEKQ
jgi:trans-aconitate methyltransferase